MVSIVVPVYNAQSYIAETIQSVIAQSYTDWELLLVDDVSKDDSVTVIEQLIADHPDRNIRLIRLEQNSGAAAARNRGIEEAQGRFIAFLDADDIWFPDKLQTQLDFMDKQDAAFTFTAYIFGDKDAHPTGKIARVPKELTLHRALGQTVIFTSTVILDTERLGKIKMPEIASEDTATWWKILQSGVTAYGLNQPLAIYRRPASSLSSNKAVAVKRIWKLYREIAELSLPSAVYYMFVWAWNATVRRTVSDVIRSHFEAFKRFTVLQMSLIGLILYTAVYCGLWFDRFYPALSAVRVSQDGYELGVGIHLYFRGHLLIIGLYFVLLIFLSMTAGGMKTGYLKFGSVFSSEAIALVLTNIITYFQLSLMKNWLLPVPPFLMLLLIQISFAAAWSYLSDRIYRNVFPPRETLMINLGDGDIDTTVDRFESRQDRFRIMKVMDGSDMDAVRRECLRWYNCVVITGGTLQERKELLEYCYQHFIRVYFVPDVGDLLIQGSEQMDLFDTPVLELKEYTIRWETRLVKRIADTVLALPIAIVTLPVYLMAGRPKTQCMGLNGKPFIKYGRGFFNVLNGTMTLVGPEAIDYERAQELIAADERFSYRCRIRPGITGYARVFQTPQTSESDKLKMDLYYIRHFSLLMDFKLLLQTIHVHGQ